MGTTGVRTPIAPYLLGLSLQDEQLLHRQRLVNAVQDIPQGFPAPRSLRFRDTLEQNIPGLLRTAWLGTKAPDPTVCRCPAALAGLRASCPFSRTGNGGQDTGGTAWGAGWGSAGHRHQHRGAGTRGASVARTWQRVY